MKKEEREEEERHIFDTARQLSPHNKGSYGVFPELGLCNSCHNLRGVVTEFGLRRAHCFHGICSLSGKQRIKHCSAFWDRTYKTIQELIECSPIFVDPKKEKIGFEL